MARKTRSIPETQSSPCRGSIIGVRRPGVAHADASSGQNLLATAKQVKRTLSAKSQGDRCPVCFRASLRVKPGAEVHCQPKAAQAACGRGNAVAAVENRDAAAIIYAVCETRGQRKYGRMVPDKRSPAQHRMSSLRRLCRSKSATAPLKLLRNA